MRRVWLPLLLPLLLTALLLATPAYAGRSARPSAPAPATDAATPAVERPGTALTTQDLATRRAANHERVAEAIGATTLLSGTCAARALDVYYVLDASGSMEQLIPNETPGTEDDPSKLEAAVEAILVTNELLEGFDNGSRVALLWYQGGTSGQGTPPTYATFLEYETGPTDDFEEFADLLTFVGPNGSTPTPHALRFIADEVAQDQSPPNSNKPVIILLSDGVPTISYEGFSNGRGFSFLDEDVQAVSVTDTAGAFRSIAAVRADGAYYSALNRYAGKPLADTMIAALAAATSAPGELHAFALQAGGGGIFNASILQYVAHVGGGLYASPASLGELFDALREAAEWSACEPVLPPDQTVTPECPFCNLSEQQPAVGSINSFSGNYHYRQRDFNLPSVGGRMRFERSFNSLFVPTTLAFTSTEPFTSALGTGWTHNYATALRLPAMPGGEPDTVILQGPHGARLRFRDLGAGSYAAYPGIQATLAVSGSQYVVTAHSQERFIFDAAGRLLEQTNAQGNVQSLSYDAGRLVGVEEPTSGASLTFGYNGQGQLTSVSDHAGRTVAYEYEDGALVSMTDTAGLVWQYVYTDGQRLEGVTDPDGRVVEAITYDNEGRATTQQDGRGETIYEIAYSSPHTQTGASTRVVLDQGSVLTLTYNHRNLLVAREDAEAYLTTYSYDSFFNRTSVTDAAGNRTLARYTPGGRLLHETNALAQTTQYSYDSLGRLSAVTTSAGDVTRYAYGGRNSLLVMTDALGHETHYGYNLLGQLRVVTDALGQTTHYGYNGLGHLAVVTDALGYVTSFGYDTVGRVVTTTNAVGQLTVNQYNLTDNLVQVTENYTTGPSGPTTNVVTGYAYNGAGQLRAMTDTLGLVTRYEHDMAGRLVTVTVNFSSTPALPANEYNLTTVHGYDAFGRRSRTTTPLGVTSFTGYDARGQVACTILNYQGSAGCATPFDADFPDENRITRYQYDEVGQRSHLTDTLGHGTRHEYDALGRLLTVTLNYQPGSSAADANLRTGYTYDGRGHMTYVTDALGRVTRHQYDALGHLLTVTHAYSPTAPADGAHNLTTAYHYDALGRQTVLTDALGHATRYGYDARGQQTVLTDALGYATTYGYDGLGQLLTVTDALGRVTRYDYDALGRTVALTRNQVAGGPLNADTNLTTQSSYNRGGYLVSQTDALGRVTHYERDSLGRTVLLTGNYQPLSEPTSDVNVTRTYAYDGLGRVVTVWNPDGDATHYDYTALGAVRVVTDALGQSIHYGYDGLGRMVALTNGAQETTGYEYDGVGRLLTVTDALSQTTSHRYDRGGRRVATTDANGVVTCYGYDVQDRLVAVTENCVAGMSANASRNVTTQYGYDELGRRTVLTDALGYATSYGYDALGQLLTETTALGYTTQYGYDGVGQRTVLTDANGVTSHYVYDGVGRLTEQDYPLTEADVSFGYDRVGQRIAVTDTQGTTTYQYDALGRMTASTNGLGAVGYGYDAAGKTRHLVFPDSTKYIYTYDALGRLSNIAGDTHPHSYTYDAANRLTSVTSEGKITSVYSYDGAGRLTSLSHATGSTLVAGYAYVRDGVGNLLAVTETVVLNGLLVPTVTRVVDYELDALYRLTAADYSTGQQFAYGYDAAGNRLTETVGLSTKLATYDAGNRLTETVTGGVTRLYSWDAAGNLLSDGVYSYGYDAAQRLVSVTDGTLSATFEYDGLNQRIGATYDGEETTYLLDQATALAEVVVASGKMGDVYYLHGQGQVLAQRDPATMEWLQFLPDHLGSVRQVVSGEGYVVNARDYDPFGGPLVADTGSGLSGKGLLGEFEEIPTTTSDPTSHFGFTGEWDDPTGLLYLRARYYAPETGSFTSPDPFAGWATLPYSQHPYQYGYSNPLRYTDPSGLCVEPANINQNCPSWMPDGVWRVWVTVGEFSTGFMQQTLYNNGGYAVPEAVEYLESQPDESLPRLVGRTAADVASICQGVAEISNGIGTISGSAALCTTTAGPSLGGTCGVAVAGVTVGAAQIAHGVSTTTVGAVQGVEHGTQLINMMTDEGGRGGATRHPPRPAGMTNTEFGTRVMRWGTGHEAARDRIATLTLEELQEHGVTLEMAEAWRDFYVNEARIRPANPSAAGRADLMQRAVELLGGN